MTQAQETSNDYKVFGPLRRAMQCKLPVPKPSKQIKFVASFLASLAFACVAKAGTPPVSELHTFDSDTSSCFFKGLLSAYQQIYNINDKICLSFYGRLEVDHDMSTVELEQISVVEGCIIVSGTYVQTAEIQQIKELHPNLEFCEYTHALLIYNNSDLKNIEFSSDLQAKPGDVFIRVNPSLTAEEVKGASFDVDIGNEGDCTINKAEKNSSCRRIIDDVKFEQLSADVWKRIKEIEGTLRIENTDAENLDPLTDLKISGWKMPAFVIAQNEKLIDISALLTIQIAPNESFFQITDNPNICHNVAEKKKLEEWLSNKGASVEFKDDCLKSCPGGTISNEYLENLDKRCNTIEGELVFDGLKELPDNMEKLEQVEKLDGRLIVRNNTALQNLSCLQNLRVINNTDPNEFALVIENNENFKFTGLKSLKKIIGKYPVTTTTERTTLSTTDNIEESTTESVGISQGITGVPDLGKKTDDFHVLHMKKNVKQALKNVQDRLKELKRRQDLYKSRGDEIYEGLQWLALIILASFWILAIIGIISGILIAKKLKKKEAGPEHGEKGKQEKK
ncbi:hypothetical protein RB195_011760 [Necator americanus]|uniref:Receptor L-domain domain-containing protein n=1 Tax=Necator americanus TaxID=51031 RepID=A0ABR1D3X1_NECAM